MVQKLVKKKVKPTVERRQRSPEEILKGEEQKKAIALVKVEQLEIKARFLEANNRIAAAQDEKRKPETLAEKEKEIEIASQQLQSEKEVLLERTYSVDERDEDLKAREKAAAQWEARLQKVKTEVENGIKNKAPKACKQAISILNQIRVETADIIGIWNFGSEAVAEKAYGGLERLDNLIKEVKKEI